MTSVSTRVHLWSLALVLVGAACGGQPPSTTAAPATAAPANAAPTASAGALARFAALKVMVLPAQAVVGDDPLGWRAAGGGDKTLISALDAAIEGALGERGLSALWVFPPALQRAARRNPMYVTEPSAMRALDAVRVALRKPNDPLSEPFASQLRALAGVSDSRYALVPMELRFEPIGPGGSGRAVLRTALVDARGAQVSWVGEVAGEAHTAFGPAVVTTVAQRVADLVVPRQ